MEFRKYTEENGNQVYTSSGISAGTVWFTVRRRPGDAGEHRKISPKLPLRNTREDAKKDLDAYAAAKDYTEVRT